jgi:hypothetical protein
MHEYTVEFFLLDERNNLHETCCTLVDVGESQNTHIRKNWSLHLVIRGN